MRVLDFAMKVEEDAKKLYEELEARATDEDMKRIFRLLAESEGMHHSKMEELKRGVGNPTLDGGSLDETRNVFHRLLEKREFDDALTDDPDGYRHVISAEEESIRTYQDLVAEATSPDAKNLLLNIIEQEKRHLEIVTNIYEFVEAPRTYLEWGEFSNLKRL